MVDLPYTLTVDRWETPATKYPLGRVGRAEITRKWQAKGFYCMEGVAGYVWYRVTKPIEVTNLKISGRIWMVDDPLHWFGMKGLAKYSEEKVLVGGLGLGLIVHALLENKKVTQIDVVEINPDVIDLIHPLLPKSNKIRVYKDNVFSFDPLISTHNTDFGDYTTVILDVWVGPGTREKANEMLSAFAHLKWRYQKANVTIWGHGAHWLNPSIDDKLREQISEKGYY